VGGMNNSVIGCFVADDLNGNSCKISFDSGECSTVSEAHAHIADSGPYGDDRHQHTEVLNACDEVFVETSVGALWLKAFASFDERILPKQVRYAAST
jgi:hypothetical protein